MCDKMEIRNKNSKNKEAYASFWKAKTVGSICLPVDVMLFLSKETSFRNPSRFSKMEALVDIMNRYIMSLSDSCLECSANIAKLAKLWCWTRVTVTKFVAQLQKRNVVTIEKENGEIRISLNPKILAWTDFPQDLLDDSKDAFDKPLPSSQHNSSGDKV